MQASAICRFMLCATLAVCCIESVVAADSMTLRKIQASGIISLGYWEAEFPFSFVGPGQRPSGYTLDICERIVDAVKHKMGLPDLDRRYVLVTAPTRFPLVESGAVDLECGVSTHTVERERRVAFTVTTFVAEGRLLSKRSAPVLQLKDMRGKVITSSIGTTSLANLQRLSAAEDLNIAIVPAENTLNGFHLVVADRAAAFAMDDALLRAILAAQPNPDDYVISDERLTVEPYAIMLTPGDPEFKRLADQVIIDLFKSGEMLRLYKKWFQSPVAPTGVNLSFPLYTSMKRLAADPTDSADPARYP